MAASDSSTITQSADHTMATSEGPSKVLHIESHPAESQSIDNHAGASVFSPKNSCRSTCAQVVATLIEITLLIDIGIEMAIPTLVLGALHKHSTDKLCMDDDQASWFGSLSHLFHFVASLASGFLQEQFGRKGSMILINIPILAAFLTLYFANSMNALYVVSITLGLCCGLVEAPLHTYIGEIAEPHLRGTLSTLMMSGVSVGIVLTYLIGYLVDWRTAALIVSVVPIITFVCMTQIPESPTWLIKRNRLDDALKSLSWLRGWVEPVEVHEEFLDLVEYAKKATKQSGAGSHVTAQSQKNADTTVSRIAGYLKAKFKEITDKRVLLPLRMVFIGFIISTATTTFPLKPYMVGILQEFGFPINSMLILVVSRSTFFIGALTNIIFLRCVGKRKMALFAHGLASAAILLLGVYCSFLNGYDWPLNWNWGWLPSLVWMPMVLFVSIDFCGGLAVSMLPWQLVCEVFPIAGRGFASGLSAAWAYVVAFIMTKSYLYLETWIELSGVMYTLGVIALTGLVYHYFYLPETEGKSLEQIESYFTNNHDRREKFSVRKPNG